MKLPDLTFPTVEYGPRETPYDLRHLLYKGASSRKRHEADLAIARSRLSPALERLPLARAIHGVLNGALAAGGSVATLRTSIQSLWMFYAYADALDRGRGISPTMDNIEQLLQGWGAALSQSSLSETSQYDRALTVARCFASVLGVKTRALLIAMGARKPKRQIGAGKADKQSLSDVFAFARRLRELCQLITTELVMGPGPVTLRFTEGAECELRGVRHRDLNDPTAYSSPWQYKRALQKASRRAEDASLGTALRTLLINLRIEAEILLFILNTGANVTPAMALKDGKWRYRTRDGGVEMRTWKTRGDSEVVYTVHSEYRRDFEAYVAWKRVMIPEAPTLFPALRPQRGSAERYNFARLRSLCTRLGWSFFSPQILRRTKGAWHERQRAGAGHEVLGNSKAVYDAHYREHSLQGAIVEISRFVRNRRTLATAAGAGACQKKAPIRHAHAPAGAPMPDCEGAGGCLFCESNRDLRSFDHCWNLVSLRSLTLHELASDTTQCGSGGTHPKVAVIDRIAAKLDLWRKQKAPWPEWIRQAEERVAAGHYHPHYTETWTAISAQGALS